SRSTTKMALRRWPPWPKRRSKAQQPKRPEPSRERERGAVSGIAQLLDEAESAVRAAEDLAALDAVRVQYLGKKGLFTAQLREIGKLPPAEIPGAGKAINTAKETLAAAIDARRAALEAVRLEAQLAADALDVTLPGRGEPPGHLHPVTRTLR